MIGQKRNRGNKKNIEELNKEQNELDGKKENILFSSKKPLWVSEVKNALKLFPSSTNELEFEKIDDIMNQDIEETIINQENHPFYTTIKKMIYSFGDVKEPNKYTIIKISNFINKYISLLIKIVQECEFKKIIECFYKEEKNRFDTIKKFRHRALFKNDINDIENCFFDNDNIKENESMINNAENNNEDNYNMDESLNELKIFGEEDEENNDNILEKEIENKNEENETKDVNNLKIEELNREIALFQDKRTELMDQKTYEEYIKCRQINFLSRGKKFFLNYMQNILNEEDKFPNEFKELTNIEFIAFILNEEIKKIIINSIKEKNPAKKLFILTQPLSPEDIDYYIQKEISILSDFLDKFHNDIIMINEFRKKKINNRVYNKFTKVKNGKNGEVFLVIKKYIFIKESEECEFLSKYKQISEVQVINGILKLREKLIKLKNQKFNNREGLRKNKNIEKNKNLIKCKEMIELIGIDNYYEYFLCKDYVRDINFEEIKINELNGYLSLLNKINKKKICSKFEEWLNLNPEEKIQIKNEFNNYKSNS